MYNDSFEEYIRSVLGYPRMADMASSNMFIQDDMNYNYTSQDSELEDCYPEIYKIVYPMIAKRCRENTMPITRELVDSMTNEIYMAIEGNEEVQININLGNEVRSEANRSIESSIRKDEGKEIEKQSRSSEDRQIGQFRNRSLRDLIRILLIRELLGRPRFPGNRPPMRPPFPGFPGNRPPRPAMRPPFPGGNRYQGISGNFENIYDLYEY